MQNDIINKIKCYEWSFSNRNSDVGLQSGMSGALIYISKHIQDSVDMENLFVLLSKRINDSTSNNKELNISDGLLGLGICYMYCLRQKGIEGDINSVLKEIDRYIFKNYDENSLFESKDIECNVELLFYLSLRIGEKFNNNAEKHIYEAFTARLLEKIYRSISFSDTSFFHKEPMPFSFMNYNLLFLISLAIFYKQEYYRIRIRKIFDELCITNTTYIPFLQSNRLAKLAALYYIKTIIPLNDEYEKHINILYENISLNSIFMHELNGKELFFSNGICGILVLTLIVNKLSGNKTFELNKNEILHIISSSPFWIYMGDDLSRLPIGLNGISGLKLLLEYIENE